MQLQSTAQHSYRLKRNAICVKESSHFVIQVGLASPAQHAIQLLLLGWLAATDGSGCPLVVLLQLLLFLQLHPCKQQTQFLCSSSAWSSHHCRSHLALLIWDLVCYWHCSSFNQLDLACHAARAGSLPLFQKSGKRGKTKLTM